MTNLGEMLTSTNAIIIYIGVAIVAFVYTMIYLIIKSKTKRIQKQNTKELNASIVEEIRRQSETPVVVVPTVKQEEKVEPVTIIDNKEENVDVVETLAEEIKEEPKEEKIELIEPITIEEPTIINEEKEITPEKEEVKVENIKEEQEELVYAPIELNQEEAREELEKLTKELTIRAEIERREEEERLKQEQLQKEEELSDTQNIALTNFEKEQEENAIISIDELMAKANDIYTQNEVVQYEDEGDEPITLEDLQARWAMEKEKINEVIQEEIPQVEVLEIEEPVKLEDAYKSEVPLKQVPFPSIVPDRKEAFQNNFKNSPIISPVYGLERKIAELKEQANPQPKSLQELQFENTANYEKFDEEIKKTNEFIATLRELQKKLD